MDSFSLPIQVRWSDIDQNRHLRHSAYYDYGATVRIDCFSKHGLTNLKFEELRIGPILFREEAIFKREIKFEDSVTIDLMVTKATQISVVGVFAIISIKQMEPYRPLLI
ncbi:MAG: acyl-CoA thioesterase [Cytophagales bacterium]|nr:acyl-CoA thioesterase [Cytophagales bacterium]